MARAEEPSMNLPVRRNRTAAIGLDAGAVGRAGFMRAGFLEAGLVLRWKEIVGPEIARIAQPLKLVDGPAGGSLTLRADPAAALFLQHESRTLVSRINAWLGRPAVQRLRFVPGEIPPEPAPPRGVLPKDPPPDDPVRRFAGPEELKTALLGLARLRGQQ